VDLENDVGPSRNQLRGLVDVESLSLHPRRVASQELIVHGDQSRLHVGLGLLSAGRKVGYTGFGVLEPGLSRRTHDRAHVVHHGAGSRTNLARRHPGIFREAGRKYDVCVVERACRRNGKRLRHFKDDIGSDAPAFFPMHRRGLVFHLTLGGSTIYPRHQRIDFGFIETAIV
jgi:hypothetical protein